MADTVIFKYGEDRIKEDVVGGARFLPQIGDHINASWTHDKTLRVANRYFCYEDYSAGILIVLEDDEPISAASL